MKFKIIFNGKEEELEVKQQGESLSLVRDGEAAEAVVRTMDAKKGTFTLEIDGRLIEGVGIVDGDKRQLWVNGRTISYERLKTKAAPSGRANLGSLSATIPAVVSEILVKVGSEVKMGDKLILLESMKMIIPIQAPIDGRVKALRCEVGESVQPGVALVELE